MVLLDFLILITVYVVKRTLADLNEQRALENLEVLLKARIETAQNGQISSRTGDDIFDSVLKEEYK